MAKYTAADGAVFYRKALEYVSRESAFNNHNNIELVEIDRGYCKVRVELTEASLNPQRVAHGALIFALGDVATGMAAITGGRGMLTQNANINFLRAASSGELTAVGREIRAGRRTGLYEAEIFGEDGKLVAKGSYTAFFGDELAFDENGDRV